jgi:hypothetical protein
VTTIQFNNQRLGWNFIEPMLTTDNVNSTSFGKKWTRTLDGQIYGTPLYVSGVMIGGQARNVVYVATENNLIYALDADNNGTPLWSMPYRLGTPARGGFGGDLSCGNISPNLGITSTPVIDPDSGILYAVGLTRDGGLQYKMVALDITNGQPRSGWPVIIRPPVTPTIDPRVTSQRGALLFANGLVYAAFGGYFGDCGSYHGWVVAVDPSNPTAGVQLYYRTPGTGSHRGSGIWAAGGIAADDDGYIYASTGNSFAAPGVDQSNAVVRLNPDLSFSGQSTDYFMPTNWRALNSADADLGSSAPLLLPFLDGYTTPNMVFITGKAGIGHLLNRDDLGGVSDGVYSTRVYSGAFSTAAFYYDDNLGPLIYLAGRGTQPALGTTGVAAFSVVDDGTRSSYVPIWPTPSIGTTSSPFISNSPGQTGIMWVATTSGVLRAFNAATGDPLYASNQVAGDALGASVRSFAHITVADGKVFVPTASNTVVAYGLR